LGARDPGLEVACESRVPAPIRPSEIAEVLRRAADLLGAPPGRVGVILLGAREGRDLNRRFRGKDRATDVLSFPDGAVEPDAPLPIGDIVICVPVAKRNAARDRTDPREEIRRLALHGFMHLLGYDHEVDGGEMAAIEAVLRPLLTDHPQRHGGRA
jgi:probable rRNA maturation factor